MYSGLQYVQQPTSSADVGGSNQYSSYSSSHAASNAGRSVPSSMAPSSSLHSSYSTYQQVHRAQTNQAGSAAVLSQRQADSAQDLRSSSTSIASSRADSHREGVYDLRVSSSNIPMRASHQTLPSQPGSGSGIGLASEGGGDGRAKVEHLQGLVDKQALQLRRRNEELLDLQRNHEAFREKFVLFREGMRSKTDESDSRFR
jgi:hypothetical protein